MNYTSNQPLQSQYQAKSVDDHSIDYAHLHANPINQSQMANPLNQSQMATPLTSNNNSDNNTSNANSANTSNPNSNSNPTPINKMMHGNGNNPPADTNFNAIQAFQQNLSFHNPFDVNSYPITNPPIFDSTMMLPYSSEGVPRRRRISISNGQIGQIINHEAFFDSDGSNNDLDEFIPDQQQQQQQSQQPQPQQPQPRQPQQPQQPPQFNNEIINHFAANSQLAPNEAGPIPVQPPPSLPAQQKQRAAGVPPPNHQLIYNNEVIFNPDAGPIPGTAAWKKERLLERNRVAALKCRQRKKQAQQQLQDNVSKYENHISRQDAKIKKYEGLLKQIHDLVSKKDFASDEDLALIHKLSG